MTAQEPNPSSPFRKPPPRPEALEQSQRIAPVPKTERREKPSGSPSGFTLNPTHGLIVVAVLLIVAIIWFGIRSGKQRNQIAATAQSATSAAREGKPRLSESERLSTTQALQALKALESVATAGLNYREYSPRVLDAKILVDRYVQSDGSDATIRRSVKDAMDLYVFASVAWSAQIEKSHETFADIVNDPRVDLCPSVKRNKDEARERPPLSRVVMAGITIAASVPSLWACASDRIAEIERALKER